MAKTYKDVMREKSEKRAEEATRKAKEWFKSRDRYYAQGHKLLGSLNVTNGVVIVLPLPLGDVFYMTKRRGYLATYDEISLSQRRLSSLRSFYKNCIHKGWIIKRTDDCVLMLCDLDAVKFLRAKRTIRGF